MSLSFPNQSRSFDDTRKAVRFLGHDGMLEVPFYVEAEALARGAPTRTTEAACLQAFDAARNKIYDVAKAAYAHGRRTIYVLTAADFR
ncbi:hypothetical protein BLJAPNOD_02450 [Ensifer sp. M14]|uniref:DUF1488 domain-containing protein n=1 Tax=Sinorhizobium/Ensifer group TaxID=227292 RepID=UPI000986D261|nr:MULTISPECIES: DUF1488 domain-containing protein [Sinorhizobium/Ensifer group]OOG67598.1 hypothetical protein B0E45_23430 [Sinorhizobium sp. A49]RDL51317.1 hypothetical protein BLJAPNOD_02450 [Ensifer sp. M14]